MQKKFDKQIVEYDHIEPLAAAGTNDLDNIQALCVGCHFVKTKREQDNGEYFAINPATSTFNDEVKLIIKSELFKRYAFTEAIEVDEYKSDAPFHCIDMNKCRRNILLHLADMKLKIPVYTCMDEPRPYVDGTIQCGFYFIESDKYFPLRGNGWYYYGLVQYCLDKRIITKANIKWSLISSLKLEDGYFNPLIERLASFPGQLSKLAPNIFIGCSNIAEYTKEKCFYTNNFNQAATFHNQQSNIANDCSIHDVLGDQKLYKVSTSTKYEMDSMNLMVYHSILDIEAMELHKMQCHIENNGGIVTYLNTDCCAFYMRDPKAVLPGIADFFWDSKKKVAKYKYEEKYDANKQIHERMKQYSRTESYKFKKQTWNIIKDPKKNGIKAPTDDVVYNEILAVFKLNTEFKGLNIEEFLPTAYHIYQSNQSFNLDGIAGAGKTTMAKFIKQILIHMQKRFVILTPTNKSADIISPDAMTIHKFIAKSFNTD